MAMLVVSVGIMAAFAMFPQGLDQGRAAVEDTQAAQFAEWLFDGYRGLSTRFVRAEHVLALRANPACYTRFRELVAEGVDVAVAPETREREAARRAA